MNLITLLNPENATDEEVGKYKVREAARAVVFDSEGKVALLHVSKKDYYKLPGGGLEGDEDKLIALARECKEEIGCDVEDIRELGQVTEYRKMWDLKQISYCYLAKVKGEKCDPDFTESELEDGFEIVWLPLEEAIETMRNSRTENQEGALYIVPRDIAILEAAKNI